MLGPYKKARTLTGNRINLNPTTLLVSSTSYTCNWLREIGFGGCWLLF